MEEIYKDLRSTSLDQNTSWYLASGELLELWGLKVIFGLYYSGVAAHRHSSLRNTHAIEPQIFARALSSKHLDDPGGLYCKWAKRTLTVGHGVGAIPIGTENPPRIGGVKLSMHGIDFDIVFDPSAVSSKLVEGQVFRPRYLNFYNGRHRHTAVLTWPDRPILEPELVITYRD